MPETNLPAATSRKRSRRSIKSEFDPKQIDNQTSEYQTNQDQSRAKWSTSNTKIFADLLVEQILQGNRSNNVFNKKAWKYIRDEFNKQTGLKFDRQQLKNHLDVLRKRYNYMKTLLDQIGFCWDESHHMVIAEDNTWEKYIEEHPEAETIRKKGCPIYDKLCMIFSEPGADRRYPLSDSRTSMHQVLVMFDLNIVSVIPYSGFSWDKSRCMVIGENEVWEKYIELQAHPEAETIRIKGCLIYEQLCRIFSEQGPDGGYASFDLQTATPQVDSEPSQDQSKHDQSRAKWTIFLDKIFADLLVGQAQQNSVSNKKAWKRIRDEFNKQTGLKFDEQQLRNHQSVLRRWYNNIKSLLDQSGFSWDESRHMVVAKDEVWEKYIKAHPEADTIRIKGCPIYKQLCNIFSESGVGGRYVQSSHDIDLDEDRVKMETPMSSTSPETTSISANPVAGSMFVQEEASSHSAEEMNASDGPNTHWFVTPRTLAHHRRIQTGTSHTIADAMIEMASATKLRAAALAQNGDKFSISNCVKVLNEMQGIDQGLYLSALDVFQDPDRRETFISIKSNIRLAWLKGKCNFSF
ncbi:hypothetical protein HHK36_002994 [Tetracentron sinense]|uniref:Myb/SANT-like domain-containing protein n=1 Tax=Tetracentron sinense TaxID=13715 RepID=A0A834ZNA2_TETSI|nr:hypothetical protein HHK36_002994 [Tetracentron sinense]